MTLGLAVLLTSLAPQGVDFGVYLEDALVDGATAYVFLQPLLVAEGDYVDAKWSDDGRYLLMVTERPLLTPFEFERDLDKPTEPQLNSETALTVANLRTGTSKTLWAIKSPKGSKGQIAHYRNSDAAVVAVSTADGISYVLRVTAGTSLVEMVETMKNCGKVQTTIGKEYAAVTAEDPPSVRFIAPTGSVLRRQPLSIPSGVSFTASGVAIVTAAKAPKRHLTVIPGGGEIWVDGMPDYPVDDEEYADQRILIENPIITVPNTSHRIPMVVARIAGHKENVTLATNALSSFARRDVEQGVLYSLDSFHFVRPVVKVPSRVYLAIAGKQERAKLLDNLTRIGRALSNYKRDKSHYPTKDEFASAMRRYLANPEIANGFNYAGPPETSTTPSTTVAGFANCRGGRMVLYQDGHVAFVAGN